MGPAHSDGEEDRAREHRLPEINAAPVTEWHAEGRCGAADAGGELDLEGEAGDEGTKLPPVGALHGTVGSIGAPAAAEGEPDAAAAAAAAATAAALEGDDGAPKGGFCCCCMAAAR